MLINLPDEGRLKYTLVRHVYTRVIQWVSNRLPYTTYRSPNRAPVRSVGVC